MSRHYPNPEIAAGIFKAIEHIEGLRTETFGQLHYGGPVTVDPDGIKFARLVVAGSVYCFVALTSDSNKKMGSWKEGDIFKADGWKGPAKHARGNVYTDLSKLGVYGPEYLK